LPGVPETLEAPTGHRFVASFGWPGSALSGLYEGWNACTLCGGEKSSVRSATYPSALIWTGEPGENGARRILHHGAEPGFYYHVLAHGSVARSSRVERMRRRAFSDILGAYLVSLLIIISTLGSLNAAFWPPPGLLRPWPRDGLFFRWCARVHPRFHTPHREH